MHRLLLVLTFLGCPAPDTGSDDTAASGDTAAPEETDDTADTSSTCTPIITVTPAAVDFGTVSSDGATEVVTVANVGCAALRIVGVSLAESTSPAFTLSAIGAILVPPEAVTTFTVACTPFDAGTATGTVVIYSDDPASSEVQVPLTCTTEA
jgi:hypothetical protein